MKTARTLVLSGMLVVQPAFAAGPLALSDAEELALQADPAVLALTARSAALRDEAVAAGQLPDPQLKLAAMALPVDTFDLDQEPMTQLQVGFVQRIPPGKTLALREQRLLRGADALGARAEQRRREVVRMVRKSYLEATAQRETQAVLSRSRSLLGELRELIEDYYGTGRAAQQEIHRAALEETRIAERLARAGQAEAEARASLSRWIGDQAYRPFTQGWPVLSEPAPATVIDAELVNHPAVIARAQQVDAAEIGVAIADEQYKPGFSFEVAYGDRSGADLAGRDLPDFLSAMVMVDLPLFRDRRQDRSRAASRHQLDAALQERSEVLRELRSEARRTWAQLERVRERAALFDAALLPQAEDNAAAALDAYQSAVGSLTELMRARILAYELSIERLALRREELVAQADLLYLEVAP